MTGIEWFAMISFMDLKSNLFEAGIQLKKIWSDNDVIELQITTCDGKSLFSNQVYTDKVTLNEVIDELEVFKSQVHGGIYDMRIGDFGPEFANGAFHARFHFKAAGNLFVSASVQGDYTEFSVNKVADEAKFYLRAEPGQLDAFILQLRELVSKTSQKRHYRPLHDKFCGRAIPPSETLRARYRTIMVGAPENTFFKEKPASSFPSEFNNSAYEKKLSFRPWHKRNAACVRCDLTI